MESHKTDLNALNWRQIKKVHGTKCYYCPSSDLVPIELMLETKN